MKQSLQHRASTIALKYAAPTEEMLILASTLQLEAVSAVAS